MTLLEEKKSKVLLILNNSSVLQSHPHLLSHEIKGGCEIWKN